MLASFSQRALAGRPAMNCLFQALDRALPMAAVHSGQGSNFGCLCLLWRDAWGSKHGLPSAFPCLLQLG